MRNDTRRDITDILARRRKQHTWQKIVSVLSCVVVFCVTYALILPAITLEKTPICEKQEHVHTAECYQSAEGSADTEVPICGLEAHTHSAECYDTPLSERTTTPLELDTTYIKGAVLSYRTDPNVEWQEVTASTTLPGDADLKLEISYEMHVTTLNAAGNQLTYTLPSILRDPTGSGPINDSSGNQMGTMTVENGVVTLSFDQTWLDNHKSNSGTQNISGKFHVESDINLTEASQNPSMTIKVGNVDIGLKFESDLIAEHADVTIQKADPTAIHDATGDYLEYTLTVEAKEDGATGVVVKDAFNAQSQGQIVGYVGISNATPAVSGIAGPIETSTPAGKAGTYSMNGTTMEWNIGKMEPNEKRILTYRVKVQDGYLGGSMKETLTNTAELFCQGVDDIYRHGTGVGNFTPQAGATLSKVTGAFTPDSDGSGGTITYTIWVQAYDTNNYTLTDVKIWDALDGSIAGGGISKTDSAYLQYLSYVTDSFRLYNGGSNGQNGDSGLTPQGGTSVTPVYQKKADGTTDNTYFITCDVGTLAPGESKTLIYKIHIGPGVFPAAGNNKPKINNRAQIHAGDKTKGNETALNSVSISTGVDQKEWSSKQSGTEQTADTTVSVSGNVYAPNGSLVGDPLTEFTAPVGSYKYTVTVNKTGDWDVSGLSMTDQLSDYSQYIGYVRVDAYNVDTSDNRTLDKTVWLAVNGLTQFTFKPSDIHWTGVQSYDLTYYTQVTIPAGASVVTVENTFTMTGKVGIGDLEYDLNGATVKATNTIQGSNSFAVSKHSWYYEPSKVETGEYANGAMYWYIQVEGNVIPANTYLRDVTSYNPQKMYDSSLVGLYTGNLEGKTVADYDDLEELQKANKLTRLDNSYYSKPAHTTYKDPENGKTCPIMTVQLKKSVTLNEGECLFLIVRTEPHENPAGLAGNAHYTYKNRAGSSYNGENWVDWGDPKTMVLYGSNGISKTLEAVRTWNGTAETVDTPEGGTAAPEVLAGQEKGTYVSWKVQLNYTGRLHGNYCVEELIPAGLELAYVECTGIGKGYADTTKPSCVEKSPGDGWSANHRGTGDLTTHYYTKGQTARWYVDGLQTDADPTKPTHTMDFRVVCRVTDADVLLGGETKEFQNQVRLLREGGKEIDSSSSVVALTVQTLSKQGIVNPGETITQIPFEVTLNPLGEDLVPEASTISLVDTLGDTLKLDVSSIQVKETGTNNPVTDWEAAVNGQTLTLKLPDQKALTVTYSAWIIAKPGEHINISNNAHWEGRSATSGGAWGMNNFEFKGSASAGTEVSPRILITKLDENHVTTVLPGAKFTLKQAELVNGEIQETNAINWEGTTGTDGKLTFGVVEGQTMEYNTIYCLREKQAPAGYVQDDTPYYFVFAKKVTTNGTEAYPTFPANVYVHYLGSEYSYQALNHKGQITVQKKFADPGGNDYGPVAGTYKFGLYDKADGTGAPLQTVTITYSDTDTAADQTAVFRDLELGKSYYVLELDEAGKPISGGGSLSNRFIVRYSDSNGVTLTAENGDQTVTVTNCVLMPMLPEAGGMGTTMLYVVGWLLLAGAAVLLVTRKRLSAQ